MLGSPGPDTYAAATFAGVTAQAPHLSIRRGPVAMEGGDTRARTPSPGPRDAGPEGCGPRESARALIIYLLDRAWVREWERESAAIWAALIQRAGDMLDEHEFLQQQRQLNKCVGLARCGRCGNTRPAWECEECGELLCMWHNASWDRGTFRCNACHVIQEKKVGPVLLAALQKNDLLVPRGPRAPQVAVMKAASPSDAGGDNAASPSDAGGGNAVAASGAGAAQRAGAAPSRSAGRTVTWSAETRLPPTPGTWVD